MDLSLKEVHSCFNRHKKWPLRCPTTSSRRQFNFKHFERIPKDRNRLPIKKYNHLLKAYNKDGKICKSRPTTRTKGMLTKLRNQGDVIITLLMRAKEWDLKKISQTQQLSHIYRLQTGQIKMQLVMELAIRKLLQLQKHNLQIWIQLNKQFWWSTSQILQIEHPLTSLSFLTHQKLRDLIHLYQRIWKNF